MITMVTKHKKGSFQLSQNKEKTMQNSDVICFICGKKHWGKPCYKEIGACFVYGKHGYMIWDCPEKKKFITEKPIEENKVDK